MSKKYSTANINRTKRLISINLLFKFTVLIGFCTFVCCCAEHLSEYSFFCCLFGTDFCRISYILSIRNEPKKYILRIINETPMIYFFIHVAVVYGEAHLSLRRYVCFQFQSTDRFHGIIQVKWALLNSCNLKFQKLLLCSPVELHFLWVISDGWLIRRWFLYVTGQGWLGKSFIISVINTLLL